MRAITVNSAEGFGDQPELINGFSNLMVDVYGEAIGKISANKPRKSKKNAYHSGSSRSLGDQPCRRVRRFSIPSKSCGDRLSGRGELPVRSASTGGPQPSLVNIPPVSTCGLTTQRPVCSLEVMESSILASPRDKMRRGDAIIFRDLLGKLDVRRV